MHRHDDRDSKLRYHAHPRVSRYHGLAPLYPLDRPTTPFNNMILVMDYSETN